MKTLITLTALMLSTACGGAETDGPVDVLNASPYVSNDVLADVMAQTTTIGGAVNLDGYTVTVEATVEESDAACGGKEVGCAYVPAKRITVPWPADYQGIDRSTLNAIAAAALAHEMGHVFYAQTTGDSDPNHTHAEWFNKDDATSVCGRVYDAFNKEVQ